LSSLDLFHFAWNGDIPEFRNLDLILPAMMKYLSECLWHRWNICVDIDF